MRLTGWSHRLLLFGHMDSRGVLLLRQGFQREMQKLGPDGYQGSHWQQRQVDLSVSVIRLWHSECQREVIIPQPNFHHRHWTFKCPKIVAGAVVYWSKSLPVMQASLTGASSNSWLLYFQFRSQFIHLGKQWRMGQVLGLLYPRRRLLASA